MLGNDGAPRAWSRRSVLAAGSAGVLAALSGCGVRLEDDAPDIPLIPRRETRSPVADEHALLTALERAEALQQAAESTGAPPDGLPARLADLHAEQVKTLERLLTGLQVPLPAPPTAPPTTASTPAPSRSPSPSSGPSGTAPTGTASPHARPSPASKRARAALATAEGRDVTAAALARLARVSTTNVDLLGSLAAQHEVASRLLGRPGAPPAITGPTRHLATQLLGAVRAAVYGFEVETAQTPPGERKAATATLDSLRTLSGTVARLAGASEPPAPMGYALPFRVHDAATRRKLAGHVLSGLAASTAGLFGAASGDAKALSGLVVVLSDAVVLGQDWGVPLRPFPGLRQP